MPETAQKISGKISAGENLKGLPYLVLDNVRIFNRNDVYAFRTLFWWGNFFSYTVHISGNYFNQLKPVLPSILNQLDSELTFICIQNDQWQYHFGPDNYLPLKEVKINESAINKILQNGFIKISGKSAIDLPELALHNAFKFYEEFLKVLSKNIRTL